MTLVTGMVGGDKAIDRPRCATDEESVDIRERGESPSIAWVDAAAIENRNPGAKTSEQIFASGSNQFGNRFDVLGAGRNAPDTDRPNWLIRDLNQSQVLWLSPVQANPKLSQYRLSADTERTFFSSLAHGEKDAHASGERRQHLAIELNVGLVEVATSLGMSQQDQIDIEGDQHAHRDLTRVGAVGRPVDVLRSNPDLMW